MSPLSSKTALLLVTLCATLYCVPAIPAPSPTSTAVGTGDLYSAVSKLQLKVEHQAMLLNSQSLLLMQQMQLLNQQKQQLELQKREHELQKQQIEQQKLQINQQRQQIVQQKQQYKSHFPPEDCKSLLVSGKNPLPGAQIKVTSSIYPYEEAARIYSIQDGKLSGSWAPQTQNRYQWLQFDFGRVRKITAVLTKGRNIAIGTGGHKYPQFVQEYQLHYGNNTLLMRAYQDVKGHIQSFPGNFDQDTIQENVLPSPIYARYLRINPVLWKGYISMRADVRGC
ncbi:lactadherin [Lingula anatina]|uniref:Lactadherin n=1 Tax=Lingula anatina TaxID=7574 RepID=A0A1S3JDC7_LINAN|nr:lactadherin [Lingula anatina]|eukprot:XP_013408420.1 lactadherin [Lingula anatina]